MSPLTYQYTHTDPANGNNYYRLKQVDLDGKWEYSPIRQVKMNGHNIVVYPNPARDNIIIKGLTGNETIQVCDVAGRIIRQVKSRMQQESIGISDLREGIHHVVIIAADGISSSYKITKLK